MPEFTSTELFTSISVICRVGNVSISILPEGDISKKYIRWNMMFFMVKYHNKYSLSFWKPKCQLNTVIFHHEKLHISANQLLPKTVPPSGFILMLTFLTQQIIEIDVNFLKSWILTSCISCNLVIQWLKWNIMSFGIDKMIGDRTSAIWK
jgi:hypothetical protein